ncbi:MAG: RidA family protein [Gammaproteobacteria bacterium]|nr:RidA family protein [Gammaproteobacteria bacterium]
MATIEAIHTSNAPQAIGPYSQAIRVDNLAFISGQIPLDPDTMEIVPGGITEQAGQVFKNLAAVISASGSSMADTIKLTIYLTDLGDFPLINEIMATYYSEPYPARATVEVRALPRGALIEVDAVVAL